MCVQDLALHVKANKRRLTWQWLVAKRKRKIAEVDWCTYFQEIQGVCPWSWNAWKNAKIDIVKWQGEILSLNAYDARVHVHINASARQLNKIASKNNDLYREYEFLWSHPQYKGVSTPLPCIIQQDRAFLTKIRQRVHK